MKLNYTPGVETAKPNPLNQLVPNPAHIIPLHCSTVQISPPSEFASLARTGKRSGHLQTRTVYLISGRTTLVKYLAGPF